MRRFLWLTIALAMALPSAAFAQVTYDGALYNQTGGIMGSAQWASHPLTLNWAVSQVNPTSNWHYIYNFSVETGDISEFYLETNDRFGPEHLLNFTGNGTPEVGAFQPEGASQVMHCVRFADVGGKTATFAFDSTSAPAWGDFFARDGLCPLGFPNRASNAGFGQDVDPSLFPASSGSFAGHILTPGAGMQDPPPSPVPDASTLALLGVAVLPFIPARLRALKRQ